MGALHEDRQAGRHFRVINKEEGAVLFIQHHQTSNLSAIGTIDPHRKRSFGPKFTPSMDERDFGIGAQILHDLNINKLKVMTNSSQKPRIGLTGYGLKSVAM